MRSITVSAPLEAGLDRVGADVMDVVALDPQAVEAAEHADAVALAARDVGTVVQPMSLSRTVTSLPSSRRSSTSSVRAADVPPITDCSIVIRSELATPADRKRARIVIPDESWRLSLPIDPPPCVPRKRLPSLRRSSRLTSPIAVETHTFWPAATAAADRVRIGRRGCAGGARRLRDRRQREHRRRADRRRAAGAARRARATGAGRPTPAGSAASSSAGGGARGDRAPSGGCASCPPSGTGSAARVPCPCRACAPSCPAVGASGSGSACTSSPARRA